jgi:hypothetical protein
MRFIATSCLKNLWCNQGTASKPDFSKPDAAWRGEGQTDSVRHEIQFLEMIYDF